MTFFYTILTNYGKTALAEALAAQQPLKIPFMGVGDGGGEYYEPTEAQTNLRHERWRGDLNDLRSDETIQGQVIAEAIIPHDIDGDWTAREIGLYDAKGGLIAVGKYPETYIPPALSGAKSQVYICIVVKVDNVAAVELIISHDTVLASKQLVFERGYGSVGSFESGLYHIESLTRPEQWVYFEAEEAFYCWTGEFPKAVPPQSTPDTLGGIGDGLWKLIIRSDIKTFDTVMDLQQSSRVPVGQCVKTRGFHQIGSGAAVWRKTAEIVAPNKLPVDLGDFCLSDRWGYKYQLVENLAIDITIEQLGALPYDNANPSVKPDLAPLWLLIMKVQKARAPYRVNIAFEHRSYYTSKGMVLREWTSFRASGKYGVQMFVGTDLYTEDEIPHSSMTNVTTWYSLQSFQLGVVHDVNTFAKSVEVSGIDFVTAAGFHTDYGLYTPYMTDSELRFCRFVGNNLGHEFKDIYSNEFDRLLFTARTNTPTKAGAYSMRGRGRTDAHGAGTSNIFNRCGWTDYTLGFVIEGMAYSTFICCYTEGTLSEVIGYFLKGCQGIQVIEWGCERLTSKSSGQMLFRISESVVDIAGLNLTWAINANNNTLLHIDSYSTVTVSGLNAKGVSNASTTAFIRTDDTCHVVINPVQYPDGFASTTNVNVLGINTVMHGKGGNYGTANNVIERSYEFNNRGSKVNTQGKQPGAARWDKERWRVVYAHGSSPDDSWGDANGNIIYRPS